MRELAVGVFALLTLANPSVAVSCEAVGEVPAFEATIPETAFPKTPTPTNGEFHDSELRLFKVELELFRQNTLEAYNKRLKKFGVLLNKIDQSLQIAVATGQCAEQYSSLHSRLSIEFTKLGDEYIESYRQHFNRYKFLSTWVNRELLG